MQRRETLLVGGILWLITTIPAAAHLWHDATSDMTPEAIEAVVAALEDAAQTPDRVDWEPPEQIVESTRHLAFEFMYLNRRLTALPPKTDRVLITYDALRFGVLDEAGRYGEGVDMTIWFDLVRPADAPTIAPFRARLDAWRASLLGAE